MSEIWGIHTPYKSGNQKLTFSTTSQLNGKFINLTAYIFGTKHDLDNRASGLATIEGVSYTSSKNDMNFGPQTA